MDLQQYLKALEKIFASKKAITPDMRLDDVGNVDSVAMLEVQALADEEFGVMLEPSDIADCKTVADLCRLVKLAPKV
jgi:acyl carrier protein